MSRLSSTRSFTTGMPFTNMQFTQHVPSYLLRNDMKYSNVSQICFGDPECIRKRDEANALVQQQLAEQQNALMQALNSKSGGLSGLAITAIVFGIAGITGLCIYLIKTHKI